MASQDSFERPAAAEISLHDIFWYIVKNWIILLICMAVIGVFFGLYKRSAQVKTVEAAAKAVKEYKALSDEEKAKVKAADIPKAIDESTIGAVFKKNLVLGAFIGLFAAAAVLAVIYVIRGYLPNAPAIQNRYQKPTFGIVPDEKTKGITRKIMNQLTYRGNISGEESCRLIAANLALYLKSSDKILLVGTVAPKTLEALKRLLSEMIALPIEAVGDINKQASAVMQIAKGGKVICVEKILGSRQTFVDFEMSTLAVSRSDCIGFILVE